jgi:ubiquinone/menaquinone biosynthesis C-methylase UbiE
MGGIFGSLEYGDDGCAVVRCCYWPDSIVLDLAAGSGDPALSIAEHVLRGKVIALDSSHGGLLLVTLGGLA